jgi:hypothetical protein
MSSGTSLSYQPHLHAGINSMLRVCGLLWCGHFVCVLQFWFASSASKHHDLPAASRGRGHHSAALYQLNKTLQAGLGSGCGRYPSTHHWYSSGIYQNLRRKNFFQGFNVNSLLSKIVQSSLINHGFHATCSENTDFDIISPLYG